MPLVGDPTLAIGGAEFGELRALSFEVEVRVCLELPEEPAHRQVLIGGQVLVGGQVLIGEEQHQVLEEEVADESCVIVVGLTQRDAVDLGTE